MNELLDFVKDYRVVEGILGQLMSFLFEGAAWFDALPPLKKRRAILIFSAAISLVATGVRAYGGDVNSLADAIGTLILGWLAPLAVATANHTRYLARDPKARQ